MRKYMLFILLPLLCYACSGIKVLNAETAENANLRQYKTFDFYSVDASGDTVNATFNERINLLKEAIGTELAQRGYVQSATHPDLLVNIGVRVNEKIQTRTTDLLQDAPRYMGQRNYSWKSEDVEVGRYREGTVTVHLVDAFKKQMVWKGAIQGIVSNKLSDARKNAREGIKELFAKFPVNKI